MPLRPGRPGPPRHREPEPEADGTAQLQKVDRVRSVDRLHNVDRLQKVDSVQNVDRAEASVPNLPVSVVDGSAVASSGLSVTRVVPVMDSGTVLRTRQRAESRERVARVSSGIIDWLGSLAALTLCVYAVLTVAGANPANTLCRTTAAVAPHLATGFTDLFRPGDPNFALVLNYGSAAIFWLLASTMIARLIRKVLI